MLDPARLRVDLGELLYAAAVSPPSAKIARLRTPGRARVDGDHATPGFIGHRRHRSQRRRFLVDRLGRCDGPVLVRLVGAGR